MCTTKFEWWREYEHCTKTEHLFYILTYGSSTEGVKDTGKKNAIYSIKGNNVGFDGNEGV